MKRVNKTIMISLISILSMIGNANAGSHGDQAIKHSSKSISHASASVGHSIVGSGQVASAVAAVPFAIVGSVGEVSKNISEDLMDIATTPIGEPLEISDESFIVGPPPSEAIEINEI